MSGKTVKLAGFHRVSEFREGECMNFQCKNKAEVMVINKKSGRTQNWFCKRCWNNPTCFYTYDTKGKTMPYKYKERDIIAAIAHPPYKYEHIILTKMRKGLWIVKPFPKNRDKLKVVK